MVKNYFTVDVCVKTYVKRFLELNCGNPADLTMLQEINDYFLNKLKHPSKQRDTCIVAPSDDDTIQIRISEDTFYRYGWEMTRTNQRQFSHHIEINIKFMWRNFIAVNTSMGIPVAKCIREFQNNSGLTEEYLKYDTIKKDYDRNVKVVKGHVIQSFREEINKILLDGLSELGTISKSYKYELNHEVRY